MAMRCSDASCVNDAFDLRRNLTILTLSRGRAAEVPIERPRCEDTRSSLLRHALWRGVGWERNPRVACLLPHCDCWRWKTRVGKAANGNGDSSGKTVILPEYSRAACRAKMIGQCVAAFGRPRPRRSLTGEGDLFQAKARLVADHGPSTTLALQAVSCLAST